MNGGNAIGAVGADDGQVGHPNLAAVAFFDQADAVDASSSPGKRARTSSSTRRLISKMISRWRGSILSNSASGHFSRASGSSVWLV